MVKPIGRDRLRQLKRAGIFPWSSLATRALIAAALFGFLLSTASAWKQAVMMQLDDVGDVQAALDRSAGGAVSIFIVSSILVCVCGLVATVVQTRGAFGGAAQRAARGRLRSLDAPGELLSIGASLVVSCVLLYRFAPALFDGIRVEDGPMVFAYLSPVIGDIVKLLVVGSLVLAVVLMFGSRLIFLLIGAKRRSRGLRDVD